MLDILKIAEKNFVPIIAGKKGSPTFIISLKLSFLDEIYENLVFPGNEFHAFSSLSHDVPVLSCGGEEIC